MRNEKKQAELEAQPQGGTAGNWAIQAQGGQFPVTDTADWTKHWRPSELVYSNPAMGQPQAEYHVTEVPAVLPKHSGNVLRVVPASKQYVIDHDNPGPNGEVGYKPVPGSTPFRPVLDISGLKPKPASLPWFHKPFVLDWNGTHYLTSFPPKDIQMVCYRSEEYKEVEQAYIQASQKVDFFRDLTVSRGATISELYDILERQRLQLDAYRMVWSARQYLYQTTDVQSNWGAISTLNSALYDIDKNQANWQAIRNKYASFDSTGRRKESNQQLHEDSPEERSI